MVCFSFSGSADLLYVEPTDSDNASWLPIFWNYGQLLPVIIIQDNRKAPHILVWM